MKRRPIVIKSDQLLPSLMVYWTFIGPATLLHFIGLRGLHSTALVLVASLLFAIYAGKKFRYSTLAAAIGLITLSLGNVVYWGDYRYLFFCVFLLCAMMLADLASPKDIQRFCTISTKLLVVLLLGAIFAALLAAAGLKPLFTIQNPDSQDYYFFYTTFTNSYQDNIIRAAGIFDEPGAFSMYICFIAALRHLLRKDRRTTWFLIVLGFVTFSLAHLIYTICHLLAEQTSKKMIYLMVGSLAFVLFVVITTIAIDSNFILLSRLRLNEDTNMFAGDNRSFQMINAWAHLAENPSAILFGLDSTCVFQQSVCQDQFGPLGENPLSPLVFGGLFSQWPYYLVVLTFLIAPVFDKRNIVLAGVGLLFLQRPYVVGFSYAFIATLLVHVLLHQVTFGRRGRCASKTSSINAPVQAASFGSVLIARTATNSRGRSSS